MFQILNPIWLFGIAGIIIPLIIHLWNIKTSKTLKIGSVILLGESSRQNASSLRLQDLLLLFLRCLLLIILALLLAEPVRTSQNRTTENKGWILIEKENFREAYSRFKAEIDSLDRNGYEFHFFDPGFKRADIEELSKNPPAADTNAIQLSYWSLVRMLDREMPKGSRAYIFTPNRLNRFKGERATISAKLSWKTYTASDSVANWIHHAYFSSTDSIKAVVSRSGPQGTYQQLESIDPADSKSPYRLDIQNGQASLSLKADPQVLENRKVIIDTNTLRIALFADKFQNDASYLKSAIVAIQKYTARKIKFTSFSDEQIPANQNLIIWLSEKKISAAQIKGLKAGSSLFIYENGKTEGINSWISCSPVQIALDQEPIALYRRILYPEQEINRLAVWEDGFGRPLLDLSHEDQISVYHFYSRFNPEWNDLVWNNDFPKMLIPIIMPELKVPDIEQYDRRTADLTQIIPAKAASDLKRPGLSKEGQSDLKYPFWLALILVFLLERWLSFRQDQI